MPRPIAGEAGYVDFRIFSDGTAIMASAKPPYYKQFEAVALPEGHGKIIDADAIWRNMTDDQGWVFQWGLASDIELFEILEAAEAIVPAEGGTDNAEEEA